MICEHLHLVPEHFIPHPFSIHWYKPGDENTWLEIHRTTDLYNDFPPKKFADEFGNDVSDLSQRQCYLHNAQGHAAGTATAWFSNNFDGGRWGRIHWVAIIPDCQGQGLAKPLLSCACRRLFDLGHERAYLTTDTRRLKAINLYLDFGFIPRPTSPTDRKAWKAVAHELDRDVPGF